MLPGYTPQPMYVQNHIHLGVVGGTGLGTYNEPPYRFGHVQKRTPSFDVIGNFERSWLGYPMDTVEQDISTNNPLVFGDFIYEVRVDLIGLDLLKRLLKRRCMVVDNVHCQDNQDHAPYTKTMYFDTLVFNEALDVPQTLTIATLTFKDMYTKSPV